jgi:hypothetical protein
VAALLASSDSWDDVEPVAAASATDEEAAELITVSCLTNHVRYKSLLDTSRSFSTHQCSSCRRGALDSGNVCCGALRGRHGGSTDSRSCWHGFFRQS